MHSGSLGHSTSSIGLYNCHLHFAHDGMQHWAVALPTSAIGCLALGVRAFSVITCAHGPKKKYTSGPELIG